LATTYPSAKQTFTNAAGTQVLSSPDHATTHATGQDTIEAVEDTLGTTGGTSVLKNFVAGDLAVPTSTGTIGTISNSVGTVGTLVSSTGTVGTLNVGTYNTVNSIPGSALSTNANLLGIGTITNLSGITTETILTGGTVIITNPSGGRLLRIQANLQEWGADTADNRAGIAIKEGAGTLSEALITASSGAGHSYTAISTFIGTASVGAHTYTVSIRRQTGAGSIVSGSGYLTAELL